MSQKEWTRTFSAPHAGRFSLEIRIAPIAPTAPHPDTVTDSATDIGSGGGGTASASFIPSIGYFQLHQFKALGDATPNPDLLMSVG